MKAAIRAAGVGGGMVAYNDRGEVAVFFDMAAHDAFMEEGSSDDETEAGIRNTAGAMGLTEYTIRPVKVTAAWEGE